MLPKKLKWVLLAGVCAMLLVLSTNGLYDTRVDGGSFAGQIMSTKYGTPAAEGDIKARFFKPIPGIIGAALVPTVTPYQALLIMDCVYFFILLSSFYWLLSLLAFDAFFATLGTIWLAFSYPLLKYGFALCTDMHGWAYATFVSALTLFAIKGKKDWLLIVASAVGLLGVLSKEPAAVGMIFGGLAILYHFVSKRSSVAETAKRLAYFCIPFCLGIGSYLISLLSWYHLGSSIYGNDYRTPLRIMFSELSAFNLLWIYFAIGVCALMKTVRVWKRASQENRNLVFYSSFFLIASLPLFVWPILVSRILFVQFLFIIPISLFGIRETAKRLPSYMLHTKRMYFVILLALPPLCSIALFLISHGNSLFNLIGIAR